MSDDYDVELATPLTGADQLSLNLKDRWKLLLSHIGIFDKTKRNKWWAYIMGSYNEPNRVFHTASYIQHMLCAWEPLSPGSPHDLEIELAIWFHAVCIDQSFCIDNEKCIDSFNKFADDVGAHLGELKRKMVRRLLRSLRTNPVALLEDKAPGQEAVLNFVDLVFSWYSQDAPDYRLLCSCLRLEQSHLSTHAFVSQRKLWVQSLLARPQIFLSHAFSGGESAARQNLERELQYLEKGMPLEYMPISYIGGTLGIQLPDKRPKSQQRAVVPERAHVHSPITRLIMSQITLTMVCLALFFFLFFVHYLPAHDMANRVESTQCTVSSMVPQSETQLNDQDAYVYYMLELLVEYSTQENATCSNQMVVCEYERISAEQDPEQQRDECAEQYSVGGSFPCEYDPEHACKRAYVAKGASEEAHLRLEQSINIPLVILVAPAFCYLTLVLLCWVPMRCGKRKDHVQSFFTMCFADRPDPHTMEVLGESFEGLYDVPHEAHQLLTMFALYGERVELVDTHVRESRLLTTRNVFLASMAVLYLICPIALTVYSERWWAGLIFLAVYSVFALPLGKLVSDRLPGNRYECLVLTNERVIHLKKEYNNVEMIQDSYTGLWKNFGRPRIEYSESGNREFRCLFYRPESGAHPSVDTAWGPSNLQKAQKVHMLLLSNLALNNVDVGNLESIIRDDPLNPQFYMRRGELYMEAHSYTFAARCFEVANELMVKEGGGDRGFQGKAHHYAGVAYSKVPGLDNKERAVEHLSHAIELCDDASQSRLARAVVLRALGRHDDANKDLALAGESFQDEN